MLRLFVAVDLPATLRQEVASLCENVNNARWCKPEQLHITLRFMGKTPDGSLPEIRRRLAEIVRPRFAISLIGAGVFPERARLGDARVLWLGLAGTEALGALKAAIDERLDAWETAELRSARTIAGRHRNPPRASISDAVATPDEQKSFSPHLTLARFSRRADATLAQFLERYDSYRSNSWTVAHFHLYRSTLSSHGARHERIDSYELAGKTPTN